ncbi:MAG: hypothetical protein KGK30_08650, partial [Elusimicrobia bacterium]|nr:hypothetical protein [Elusimicrobiota bacterium]
GSSAVSLRWTTACRLPKDFKIRKMLPVGGKTLLIAGCHNKSSSMGLEDEEACIIRFGERGLEEVFKGPKGSWVTALSASEETALAVLNILGRGVPNGQSDLSVEPGRQEQVLLSRDAGKSWNSQGRIPEALQKHGYFGVTTIAVAGPTCFWLRGHTGLIKSRDGGRSWREIPSPLPTTGVTLPMAADDEKDLLLGSEGLVRSGDGGQTWALLSKERIEATDGLYVTRRQEKGGLEIGKIADSGLLWVSHLEESYLPMAVAHRGEQVFISAAPVAEKKAELGWFLDANKTCLLASPDGGKTFHKKLVPAVSTDALAISPRGIAWMIDSSRRVYWAEIHLS